MTEEPDRTSGVNSVRLMKSQRCSHFDTIVEMSLLDFIIIQLLDPSHFQRFSPSHTLETEAEVCVLADWCPKGRGTDPVLLYLRQ